MSDALAKRRLRPTDDMEDADLVLLNTCHIREKAAEKVYSALGRLRDMKKKKRRRRPRDDDRRCRLRRAGRRRGNPAPGAGRRSRHRPADLSPAAGSLKRVQRGERVVDTDYAIEDKFEHLPAPDKAKTGARRHRLPHRAGRLRQVLHLLRRALYARLGSLAARRQIVAEAQKLVDAGVREITLLGQNVNAWHGLGADGEKWGLGELLHRLTRIEGLARLRYTTSHPRDMDDRLIEAHRDLRS
jgi:tRNA-2-methylthio-N6-dimethylallyladenosine synthase